MLTEPLVFAATSDLAGKTRGKSFPASESGLREARGVGWTPTNIQITCFDSIAESPFGSFGDLLLKPDALAEVYVDFEDGTAPEHFMLGDILELDGSAWSMCTRGCLRKALSRLSGASQMTLVGAFEHEFQIANRIAPLGEAYGLRYFSSQRKFGESLMAALKTAGLHPDTFMKEYGPDQFEVTVGPEKDIRIADAAVMLRELTYMVAQKFGEQPTFTPIRDLNSVGNGVHIHLSFQNEDGNPVTYSETGLAGLSPLAASFVAGVLKYLDVIVAFTAPSVISYLRLTPHRWSAAFNNLGVRDREAAVRICPVTSLDPQSAAEQFNFEFRAADAAASPHLALAAIVHAGVQGIEEKLLAPAINEDDLSLLDDAELTARGYQRLPESLEQALQRLEASAQAREWFGAEFVSVYLAHKRAEIAHVAQMTDEEQCALYAQVY